MFGRGALFWGLESKYCDAVYAKLIKAYHKYKFDKRSNVGSTIWELHTIHISKFEGKNAQFSAYLAELYRWTAPFGVNYSKLKRCSNNKNFSISLVTRFSSRYFKTEQRVFLYVLLLVQLSQFFIQLNNEMQREHLTNKKTHTFLFLPAFICSI